MTSPAVALGIKLQAAFGDDPFDTTHTWVDISDDLEPGWQISRGRRTPFSPFDAGTFQFGLNDPNGDYDPLNTGSAYNGDLVDDLALRLRCDPNGTEFDLINTYVDSWDVNYRKDLAIAEVSSTDLMKFLERWEGVGPSSGAWLQQTCGARIAAVRDQVGIPSAWSNFGASTNAMRARPGQAEVNGATEIFLAARTEAPWADVFVTRDNVLRFDSAAGIATRTGITTVQATVSTLAADRAIASMSQLRFGRARAALRTLASGAAPSGTIYTATASAAVDLAWTQDYSQIVSESSVAAQVGAVITMFGTPRYGPRRAVIDILQPGALAEALLSLDLRDRVRVKHTTPAGVSIDVEAHVQHVQIEGLPGGKVRVDLDLLPADFIDSLNPTDWLRWDVGRWSTNDWGPL